MGHKHQTTDAARVKRLLDDGVTVEELAKEFGITKEGIQNWLRKNEAPYWTRCACEALERRRGKQRTRLILCQIPSAHLESLIVFVKALGGALDEITL